MVGLQARTDSVGTSAKGAHKVRPAECQDRLRRQNRFDFEDEDLDLPVDGNGTYLRSFSSWPQSTLREADG